MNHYHLDKQAQEWVCKKEVEHKITWRELLLVFVVSAFVLFGAGYALDQSITWV
jgi:hypothetical protein